MRPRGAKVRVRRLVLGVHVQRPLVADEVIQVEVGNFRLARVHEVGPLDGAVDVAYRGHGGAGIDVGAGAPSNLHALRVGVDQVAVVVVVHHHELRKEKTVLTHARVQERLFDKRGVGLTAREVEIALAVALAIHLAHVRLARECILLEGAEQFRNGPVPKHI